MPKLSNKEACCGCSACFNICPKKAIEMTADKTGFLYPVVNEKLCIECRLCEKSCPTLVSISRETVEPHAYVGRHKNLAIREESTSGGIFTAIAEFVISQNGVVFGAAMDDDFIVRHKYVQNTEELFVFRNSKYVQSEIGFTYQQCKRFLEEGKIVCFSGTPCQIHGLFAYLKNKYKNLITVDIVCHSVPSPLIFKKYMELQKMNYPSVNRVVFRDKEWGYSYSTMALYEDSKCLYRKGSESDLWFRSFLPGLCDRENCYDCQYQSWPRISDITIWDCFTINKIYKQFDDNHGTTSIMTWTKTGKELIESIHEKADTKEIDTCFFNDKIKRENNRKITVNHDQMYLDAESMNPEDFFNKYLPTTGKVWFKIFVKSILRKLGLIHLAKKILG